VLTCSAHLSVRHQEGLYPVVMELERDPIGNGDGAVRHLEAPPETLGEEVEQRPGQAAQGAVQLLDGVGRQGNLSRFGGC
jgi:hypothetical protein